MEKEAVADIAGMHGWRNFLGHLCGGGTMANLEPYGWRANCNRKEKLSPANKLITHGGSAVFCIAIRNALRAMRGAALA